MAVYMYNIILAFDYAIKMVAQRGFKGRGELATLQAKIKHDLKAV